MGDTFEVKNMILLTKCRPKGGENFGVFWETLFGSRVVKVEKETVFGAPQKKTIIKLEQKGLTILDEIKKRNNLVLAEICLSRNCF